VNGIELIAKERQRQIDAEGFTPDHDDGHGNGELIAAARCYAQYAQYQHVPNGTADGNHPQWWPWDEEWWKPSADPIRNIAKAGALLAADIDRRNRKAGQLVAVEYVSAIPEVTMQHLINAGLNAFGLQLFVESIASHKDAGGFKPITFKFRGIKITMEPDGPIDTSHH